jgi:MFS family permease
MDHSRRQILVLAIARLTDTVGNGILIVLLPAYLGSELLFSDVAVGPVVLTSGTVIGVAVSIYSFVSAGLQRFTGKLSDWVGQRRLFVLAGLGIVGVCNFVFPLTTTYWQVLLVHAFQGVGAAFALPASMALVNDITSGADRGGDMGIFNSIRLLGYVVGPILGGTLIAGGPYRLALSRVSLSASGLEMAFWIAGLFVCLGLGLVGVCVSEPERKVSDDESGSLTIRGDGQLLHPVFALGVATFCVSITVDLVVALQSEINAQLSQGSAAFGMQYAALISAIILLMVPCGAASDRFGRRAFLLAGAALLVPTILVQGFIRSELVMIVARFAQGTAIAMAFTPALSFAGDFATSGNSGQWLAVITSAYGLGRASGPILGGLVGQLGYAAPFLLGGTLGVIAFGLVVTQVKQPAGPAADHGEEQVQFPDAVSQD